jgi:DNA-binding CsgD family transcriptional regulator
VTPREREIIRGLVCYRRVSTVADVLGISVHTARNHLKSIFRKLNLHSQDELLRFLLDGESV